MRKIAFCETQSGHQFQTPSPQQTEGSSAQSILNYQGAPLACQKQEKLISQLGTPKTSRSRDVPFEEKIKWTAFTSGFSFVGFLMKRAFTCGFMTALITSSS